MAIQSFQDYLKYYKDTDRASNAQFYIGECYYSQKNYKDAISAYDLCSREISWRKQSVSAAQLHKGFGLLALDEKAAGIRELRSLIQRSPDSQRSRSGSPAAEKARCRRRNCTHPEEELSSRPADGW